MVDAVLFHIQQSQQYRFQGDEFITHFLGILGGLLEHFVRFTAQVWLSAGYLGQRINLLVQYKCYLLTVHAQFLEDEVGDIFTYFHHALKYMHGLDGLLSTALYQVHSLLHCFLRFNGKVVKVHILFSFLFYQFHNTWEGAKDLPLAHFGQIVCI